MFISRLALTLLMALGCVRVTGERDGDAGKQRTAETDVDAEKQRTSYLMKHQVRGEKSRGEDKLTFLKSRAARFRIKHKRQMSHADAQACWGQWGTDVEMMEAQEITPCVLPNMQKFENNARFDSALLALTAQEGRHAYVIPGTDSSYSLAACTCAKMLRDLGKSSEIELVGVHSGDQTAKNNLENCGQFDHVVETSLKSKRSGEGYYSDIAVKFAAFGEEPFTKYSRVIALDADVQPLKNLDFLFDVPAEFQVFAPRAYWISPDVATGGVYGIRPTSEMHQSLLQLWNSPSDSGKYPAGEMDVVNNFFHEPSHRAEMGLLPANFMVLDSHWHLQEEKAPPTPDPHPGSNTFEDIYTMHFTGYQKPWYHSEDDDLAHFSEAYRPVRRKWWDAYKAVQTKVAAS